MDDPVEVVDFDPDEIIQDLAQMQRRAIFTVEFLKGADPSIVTYAGDRVAIRRADGEFVFRLGPETDRFADRGWPPVRIGILVTP